MKKFLAVIMSLVMMFSLAALPVAAAQAEEETKAEETITLEEFFETVELTVELIEDTINKIHYIVGTILGMLDKECPLCAEVHQIETPEQEAPETELPEDIEALLAA